MTMDNKRQNTSKKTNRNYSDPSYRDVKLADREACTGCGACVEVCKRGAIIFERMDEGFYYPFIRTNLCIKCKKCEKVCPVMNDQISLGLEGTFIFQHSNKMDLMNSSSGGAFIALARSILQSGGLVYGCSFSPDFKTVEHVRVSNINELIKIQKSKYLQSRANQHFCRIKEELSNNHLVLFSGTPCQIHALKGYLGKDFENLLTCAIVCHGVPSEMVWQSYIRELEIHYKSSLISYDFRDKSYGWHDYSVRAIFLNGKVYSVSHLDDPYMKCYLNNYSLRSSCYNCLFSGRRCGADILMGDAWSIEKKNEVLDTTKGITRIWVFSNKGIFYVKKMKKLDTSLIKTETELFEDRDMIRVPINRDAFFVDIDHELAFSKVLKKYVKDPLVISVKRKIKFWMKKILSNVISER